MLASRKNLSTGIASITWLLTVAVVLVVLCDLATNLTFNPARSLVADLRACEDMNRARFISSQALTPRKAHTACAAAPGCRRCLACWATAPT